MSARPVVMWAPILQGKRGEWIWHCGVARTRSEAKALYLEGVPEDLHHEYLEGVRFARVTVTEVEK